MRIAHFSFLTLAIFALSACDQAYDGFLHDVNNLGVTGISADTAGPKRSEKLLESPCPKVELVNDLSSLNDFTNDKKQTSVNLIARVDMHSAQSTCKVSNNSVTVDLKLTFKGKLGPKGRHKKSDKPFFSYPFFVAVTSPSGKIMAKEIFSASMAYNAGQNTRTYQENLRQIIPVLNKDVAKHYRILAGFQLSPAQLAYNREHMISVKDALKIPTGLGFSKDKE